MTIQELIDKLSGIEDKATLVCKTDEDGFLFEIRYILPMTDESDSFIDRDNRAVIILS